MVLEPGTSKNELAWLLDKNFENQFPIDSSNPHRVELIIKFKKLLSQIVPSIKGSTFYPGANEDQLASFIFDMLEYGDFEIFENRYALFAGCVPHNCAERGFVCIDTQTGKSVIGVASSNDHLYITSKNDSAETVPNKTKEILANWYKTLPWGNKRFALPIIFFDIEKNTNVPLPSIWLTEQT